MVSEEFLRGVCDNLAVVTEFLKRGDIERALEYAETTGGPKAKMFLQDALKTKNPYEVVIGLTEVKSKVENGIEKMENHEQMQEMIKANQEAAIADAQIEADIAEDEEAKNKIKAELKSDRLDKHIDWKAEKARIEREIKAMKAEKKKIRDEAQEIKRQMRKEKDKHKKQEYENRLKAIEEREKRIKQEIEEKRKEKSSIRKDKGKSNTPVLEGNARQVSADKNMLQQQMLLKQMQQR